MREDLKLAGLLGIACALATLALFPYLLQVMPQVLAKLPIPLPVVIAAQSAQALLLLGLLAFCGLRMGHRIGIGAPWLRALLSGAPRMAQPWWQAIACGLLAPLTASSEDAAAPAATAAPAESASATASTGTIIFFREKKFAGSAIRYKVRENGVELCKLQSGVFCTVQAPIGKHEYEVHSEAKDKLTLEVESGETYYVIGGISMGVFAGHPNLSPSDKATFEGMKAKLKDNTGKFLGAADDDKDGKDDKSDKK